MNIIKFPLHRCPRRHLDFDPVFACTVPCSTDDIRRGDMIVFTEEVFWERGHDRYRGERRVRARVSELSISPKKRLPTFLLYVIDSSGPERVWGEIKRRGGDISNVMRHTRRDENMPTVTDVKIEALNARLDAVSAKLHAVITRRANLYRSLG